MSKPDWSFLENLLEEGQEYSTGIGRIWLTVLFLFRLLVLGTAAESAWNDEQADFVCNTKQPGCEPVCYDKAFPISHFRYFVLQVIFVSTPTIFYFGYVAIRARREIKVEEVKDEEAGGGSRKGERNNKNVTEDSAEEKKEHDNCGKGIKADKAPPRAPKLKGRLLCAYAFSTLFKAFLEAAFIVGLWILYDGFFIKPKFECVADPCPHTVDCFVSRPTEKTIFTIYTQVIAAISLLLNVVELLHLVQLALSHHLDKRYRTRHRDYLPWSEQVSAGKRTPEIQTEASQSDKAGSQINPSVRGQAQRYRNPRESHGDGAIEMNSRPEEDANDLLPSYVNCMGAMRISQPPRDNYKKQAHPTLQNSKGAHKGHSKQKHYV